MARLRTVNINTQQARRTSAAEDGLGVFQIGDESDASVIVSFSIQGGPDDARGPLQQAHAQTPLQLFDGIGNCRTGQSKVLRRQREAAPFGDAGKDSHSIETVHGYYSTLPDSDADYAPLSALREVSYFRRHLPASAHHTKKKHMETNKVAIVTGASRGIGAAIAARLASDGFTVVINYAGKAAAAEEVAGKIEAAGGKALTAQADVSDPTAVRRLFATAEEAFGGVDVLVNNAGIMPLTTIAETGDAVFDRVIAVNLKGTFNTLREAAQRLRVGGRIINMSTSQVGLLHPSYGIYAAAKAGVEAMTHVLSKELRGRDITVNAVAPGPTATDLFLEGKSDEVRDRFAKLAPLERLGTPQDIAGTVAFLAGPDGAWVNGQVLRANGGII